MIIVSSGKMFWYTLVILLSALSSESDITKERIQKILSTGANVILTTGGIDDLCLKYFVEAGAMAVRRCKKADLKRIAKATGGLLYLYISQQIMFDMVLVKLGLTLCFVRFEEKIIFLQLKYLM